MLAEPTRNLGFMILRLFSEVAFLVGLQQNGDVYTFDTLQILELRFSNRIAAREESEIK